MNKAHHKRLKLMKDQAPKEIYLQVDTEDPWYLDVSWCKDRINDSDIKYFLDMDPWINTEDELPSKGMDVVFRTYTDQGNGHGFHGYKLVMNIDPEAEGTGEFPIVRYIDWMEIPS